MKRTRRAAIFAAALLFCASAPQWPLSRPLWQWEPSCTPGLVAGYRGSQVLLYVDQLQQTPAFRGVLVIQYGDIRHVEMCALRPAGR